MYCLLVLQVEVLGHPAEQVPAAPVVGANHTSLLHLFTKVTVRAAWALAKRGAPTRPESRRIGARRDISDKQVIAG